MAKGLVVDVVVVVVVVVEVVVSVIFDIHLSVLIREDTRKHFDAIKKFVPTDLRSLYTDRRSGDSSEQEANGEFHLRVKVVRDAGKSWQVAE